MNPLDRLLHDELNRLLDRIAVEAGEGTMAGPFGPDPRLRALTDEAEAQLTALRAALLDRYEAWQTAIEECEDLWALRSLRATETATDSGRRAA